MSNTSDREILTVRVIDAPRELVFQMWTDPHHVCQWWGPNGFTTTIQEMDVRPGGVWRLVMHGPDGRDYQNKSVYVEVDRPRQLVFDHVSGPKFQMVTTFDEVGPRQTKVTMRHVFDSAEAVQKILREHNAAEGAKQTLQHLSDYLATVQNTTKNPAQEQAMPNAAAKEFVISRTFDAPRELVWKAWTEPQRLKDWFGPKGVSVTRSNLDLRPGGTFHFAMRTPDGKEIWGKFVYREVTPPKKLVWVHSFSDEKGGLTRHPMSATWPLELLSTVEFTEAQGRTTITLKWVPLNATQTEIDTFNAGHESMKGGWGGTFEQLAEYLVKG